MKFKDFRKDHKIRYLTKVMDVDIYMCEHCELQIKLVKMHEFIAMCTYMIETQHNLIVIDNKNQIPTCEYILRQKMIADIIC